MKQALQFEFADNGNVQVLLQVRALRLVAKSSQHGSGAFPILLECSLMATQTASKPESGNHAIE
eukprot:6188794-Amphidinium_carterae.1